MKVVREHLDDHLHEVLLRDDILAVDHLLEDRWQDRVLVELERHAIELAQAHEVRADEDAQFAALCLALLALARVAEVLLTHPELVHLDKVGENKRDAVAQLAGGAWLGARRQVIARHAREVVAQKEATRRVLHAATHLHHVLHDLLDRRIGHGHVDAADGDHEVEARHDVAAVLHELVQVREVVLAGHVRVIQVT